MADTTDKDATPLRVRRSITELQEEHAAGNTRALDDLMRAWKTIKELPPEDPRSFIVLGGYHGEPFRGAGWGSSAYWGGYCNHGNVLFPTWHRAYLVKLEEALRSVSGCGDVTLPYWDETSEASRSAGIPEALTKETHRFGDGTEIENPLRSFVFTKNIKDHINNDSPDYSKPKGYETVRYPLSGLVGTEADRKATEQHNAQFSDPAIRTERLNGNIVNWLSDTIHFEGSQATGGQVAHKYRQCFDAPNYTVFSNTTSAAEWNDDRAGSGAPVVVPLESPHNSIHLAVGGFDVPGHDLSVIRGANGDMGENDTAGLDPIFFFHHCFVDLMFWEWQRRHDSTGHLEIIPEYPGTNSVDSQGPTPGVQPNSWLTLDSPLDPFDLVTPDGSHRRYTSNDCIDIENQLGYTYAYEPPTPVAPAGVSASARKVAAVAGVNRAPIRGSFLVSVFGEVDGERVLLGTEAVLSRWSVEYCANCQTHLELRTFVDVSEHPDGAPEPTVEIHTRDGIHAGGRFTPHEGARPSTTSSVAQTPGLHLHTV